MNYKKIKQIVSSGFDFAFYEEKYGEFLTGSKDTVDHYLTKGWLAGYDPNPNFSTQYYLTANPDVKLAGVNPYLHFLLHGQQEGRSAVSPLLPEVEPLMRSDERLKLLSSLVDDELGKNDLDFLATCENHYFNKDFYKKTYFQDNPKTSGTYEEFLSTGFLQGHYPNIATAMYEIGILNNSKLFDHAYIEANSHHQESRLKSVTRYILEGQHLGVQINSNSQMEQFLPIYRSLSNSCFCPVVFFERNFNSPWVYLNSGMFEDHASKVQTCTGFNAVDYKAIIGKDFPDDVLSRHYVLFGLALNYSPSNSFDNSFYINTYPDIARSRVIPVVHYEIHGRNEKRISLGEDPIIQKLGKAAFDPQKPSMLIFSHEASLTGAPIVALNLVKQLSEQYNIVSWIGKEGPLEDEFARYSTEMLFYWGGEVAFKNQLARLYSRHGTLISIVNSVVCQPVVSRLRRENILVLSLIHEFATYAFPKGSMSRMIFSSNYSVFPADIVEGAFLKELSDLKVTAIPDNIAIHHQGYNSTTEKTPDTTVSGICSMINASHNDKQLRVVLGAGMVETRKGVDLFLNAAKHVVDLDKTFNWRFIWVGGGYDPSKDFEYSIYLEAQIEKNGLSEYVTFYGHQNSLDPFWELTDVFFLSSRLDPFPNVVLDAVTAKIPVICFNGATGFSALEKKYPYAIKSVDYCDTYMAAKEIVLAASRLPDIAAQYSSSEGSKIQKDLSFDKYIQVLQDLIQKSSLNQETAIIIKKKLNNLSRRELVSIAKWLPEVVFKGNLGSTDTIVQKIADYCIKYEDLADKDLSSIHHCFEPLPFCGAVYENEYIGKLITNKVVYLHANNTAQLVSFFASYNTDDLSILISLETEDKAIDTILKAHKNAKLCGFGYIDFYEALLVTLKTCDVEALSILDISRDDDFSLTSVNTTILLSVLSGRVDNFSLRNAGTIAIVPRSKTLFNFDAPTFTIDNLIGFFNTSRILRLLESNAGAYRKMRTSSKSTIAEDHIFNKMFAELVAEKDDVVGALVPAWIA